MNKIVMLVLIAISSKCFSAIEVPAFAGFAPAYTPSEEEKIEVGNMPPVRSQDGMNVCYGFSSWTIINQFQCREAKSNCKKLDPAKTVSPLHLAAFAIAEKTPKAEADRLVINEGGASGNSLKGLYRTEVAYAESCYPYDQFIEKNKNDVVRMNAAFEKIRTKYFSSNVEGNICVDCLVKDLDDNFSLKRSNKEVLAALASKSFDKFLFEVILGSCRDIVEVGRGFKINAWPAIDFAEDPKQNSQQKSKILSQIKSLLKDNIPLTIGACLDKKNYFASVKCETGHDFVISGYRKFCKPDGTCKEALRVQNSWGEEWQEKFRDGWVDADTLLDYIDRGKNSMVWLTKG